MSQCRRYTARLYCDVRPSMGPSILQLMPLARRHFHLQSTHGRWARAWPLLSLHVDRAVLSWMLRPTWGPD